MFPCMKLARGYQFVTNKHINDPRKQLDVLFRYIRRTVVTVTLKSLELVYV